MIKQRQKLKYINNTTRSNKDWDNFTKQRNFCGNLIRNTKKGYFQKLNMKDLTDK